MSTQPPRLTSEQLEQVRLYGHHGVDQVSGQEVVLSLLLEVVAWREAAAEAKMVAPGSREGLLGLEKESAR